MKILFCTDGSKISFNALKNFRHWIEGADVDIICIIDWSFLPDEVSIDTQGFASSCANVADSILDFAQKQAEDSGLKVNKLIKQCGSATEGILTQLQGNDYDFVVLGSHGKKGIQKWLGSVSQSIVEHSGTCSYISKHENTGKKLLLTTDGTQVSLDGATQALPHLNLKNKEIYICMVNEEPGLLFLEGTLDANWLLQIEQQQEEYAAIAMNKIQKVVTSLGYEVKQTQILTGNPAKEIINYANQKKIDLILLSSKQKDEKKQFLKNSVCTRVLENTGSDVIVAKKHLY